MKHTNNTVITSLAIGLISLFLVACGKSKIPEVTTPYQKLTTSEPRWIAFSENESSIIVCARDQATNDIGARLYDIHSTKMSEPFIKSFHTPIWAVFFDHDSKLFTVSREATAATWDIQTQTILSGFDPDLPVRQGEPEEPFEPPNIPTNEICDAAITLQGPRVLVRHAYTHDDKRFEKIEAWDVITSRRIYSFDRSSQDRPPIAPLFTPDGLSILTPSNCKSGDCSLNLLEVSSGQLLKSIPSFYYNITRIFCFKPALFSKDASFLIGCSSSNTRVNAWNLKENKAVTALPKNPFYITSIAAHPQRPLLAIAESAREDLNSPPKGRIHLWDFELGKEVAILNGEQQQLTALAFSPSGTLLASGSEDGTTFIWKIQ